MPITTTPPEEEIRSRAQLLSSREPSRDDILKARGATPENGMIPPEQGKALKSAFNVAKDKGELNAADSQAKIFAAAMTTGMGQEKANSAFATQQDVQKAQNARDNMLAQFTSQMMTNPLPALMSNLQGEGAPGKKNIFQNYMAELATAGIKDPRQKLQLLNEFKTDVNNRVQEVKGNFFNKQQTQMFLLQAAQKKVEDTNTSFLNGLANEQDLKKAKMEAEKFEMDMKIANAQYNKLTRAITDTKDVGADGIYDPANRARLVKIQNAIDSGDDVYEWIDENTKDLKERDRLRELYDEYNLLAPDSDERRALLGLPPKVEPPVENLIKEINIGKPVDRSFELPIGSKIGIGNTPTERATDFMSGKPAGDLSIGGNQLIGSGIRIGK